MTDTLQNPLLPLVNVETQRERAVADAVDAIRDARIHHINGLTRADVSDAQAHHDRGFLAGLIAAERAIHKLTKEATT